MIGVLLCFAITGLTLGLILGQADSPARLIIKLFLVFAPLSVVVGVLAICRAMRYAIADGWTRQTEGLAVFGFLALAWGHDSCRRLLFRVATDEGYYANWLQYGPYRIVTDVLLVIAVAAALRWLIAAFFPTDRKLPAFVYELPWIVLIVLWTSLVVFLPVRLLLLDLYEALL